LTTPVRPDPKAEPARSAFRWPAERPRPTPPGGKPVVVKRPLGWKTIAKHGIIWGSVGVALAIYLAPAPAGLSVQGKTSWAVFILCTGLWVSNAIPFGITGLLAVALLAVTGAMKTSEAFAAFGNSAVFFLIGVFIIAGALIESGLSKRCALLFLRPFERSPYAFATGIMLAGAFGTLWMPNQATSALLFPIAVEVALALRLAVGTSSYAKVLFLSLAWGAMIGSNASFLGSTRAALAIGMLQEKFGVGISFTQWVIAALPMVVLGCAAAPFVLRLCFPREEVGFSAARAVLEDAVKAMGPMGRRQWTVATIVVLTIAAWMIFGQQYDLAVIALLGSTALFATRAIAWEEAERRIYWNIVLMYGGAIALGIVIDRTGAAHWLVDAAFRGATIPPALAVAAVALGTLLLSEFMSNVAAVAVMLPLAFSIASQLGASPVALTLATSMGAGLDFALPFSSAPNTIVFSSGYLRMMDVVKAGGVMTIVSILLVVLLVWVWWPLLGLV
jgi:solute carrier family 13 (sodium-dependent dicarboxylate transporter), member 2/3/5